MAKFTKLNIGDAVASSGGRVWKKLSAKVALPEWNGINLTGTTWYVPSGWSATSGYGKFNIAGPLQVDGEDFENGGYIGIGYTSSSSMKYTAKQNCFAFGESAMVWGTGTSAQALKLTIEGGASVTYNSLISWLKQNGELLSHAMPTITFTIDGKSYEVGSGTTWKEWIYAQGGGLDGAGYVCFNPGLGDYQHITVDGTWNTVIRGETIITSGNYRYYFVDGGGSND